MAIRDAARQAWVTARSDREGDARAYLAELLAPFEVTALATADVQVEPSYTLFVLHDPEDDVHLAVRTAGGNAEWEAFVVADENGWTMHGEPIRSLAHLHELLPEPAPEDEGAAYPVWAPQVAVAVGDRYVFDGVVYEVRQAHTTQVTWEPPNVPALWNRAAG